jgi:hypothetical protein
MLKGLINVMTEVITVIIGDNLIDASVHRLQKIQNLSKTVNINRFLWYFVMYTNVLGNVDNRGIIYIVGLYRAFYKIPDFLYCSKIYRYYIIVGLLAIIHL